MATSKEYAYYLKGNKVAIVERDYNDSGGLTSPSSAPSIDLPNAYAKWKSPNTAATDGIEVEYTYSPTYTLPTSYDQNDQVFITGWIVQDGYLAFVADMGTAISNSSSVVFDWADWAGVATPVSDTHILVKNSSRWNGIHKVQSYTGGVNDGGIASLKTYTKVNMRNYGYWTGTPTISTTTGSGVPDTFVISIPNHNDFAAGSYIWISGTQIGNRGFYKITEQDYKDGTESSGTYNLITGLLKYIRRGNTVPDIMHRYIDECTNYEHTAASGNDFALDADTDGTMHINQAFIESDNTYLIHGVDVLNDESDTIDLPPYLSKALVLYIKGQLAEDQGEFQMKEYYMKEFRRMAEKHESGKVWASRMISSGPSAIR